LINWDYSTEITNWDLLLSDPSVLYSACLRVEENSLLLLSASRFGDMNATIDQQDSIGHSPPNRSTNQSLMVSKDWIIQVSSKYTWKFYVD